MKRKKERRQSLRRQWRKRRKEGKKETKIIKAVGYKEEKKREKIK